MKKGLFFRGSEALPFGDAIRPVAELLDYFLGVAAPNTLEDALALARPCAP